MGGTIWIGLDCNSTWHRTHRLPTPNLTWRQPRVEAKAHLRMLLLLLLLLLAGQGATLLVLIDPGKGTKKHVVAALRKGFATTTGAICVKALLLLLIGLGIVSEIQRRKLLASVPPPGADLGVSVGDVVEEMEAIGRTKLSLLLCMSNLAILLALSCIQKVTSDIDLAIQEGLKLKEAAETIQNTCSQWRDKIRLQEELDLTAVETIHSLSSKVQDLEKECEELKKKSEAALKARKSAEAQAEAMKKQSQGLTVEYERLVDEMGQLKKKYAQGDAR